MTKKQKRQQKGSSIFPLILVVAGIVLILGAIAYYSYLGTNTSQQTAAQNESSEGNTSQVSRVSLKNAKAAHELGNAVFVDVRTAEQYAESRIPGALSIPLAELPERISELDRQAWIITY
jgi:3-mercaptopyruvate sulfurtransferase SseA